MIKAANKIARCSKTDDKSFGYLFKSLLVDNGECPGERFSLHYLPLLYKKTLCLCNYRGVIFLVNLKLFSSSL